MDTQDAIAWMEFYLNMLRTQDRDFGLFARLAPYSEQFLNWPASPLGPSLRSHEALSNEDHAELEEAIQEAQTVLHALSQETYDSGYGMIEPRYQFFISYTHGDILVIDAADQNAEFPSPYEYTALQAFELQETLNGMQAPFEFRQYSEIRLEFYDGHIEVYRDGEVIADCYGLPEEQTKCAMDAWFGPEATPTMPTNPASQGRG